MEVALQTLANSESDVELVEHKGIGHPDTICDALAEQLSVALSRFYLERFGSVLHHNVDKALLWAGRSRPCFGGGEVIAPMEIFLAGRATCEVNGATVPIGTLAAEASQAWLRAHLHALDAERHVRLHCLVRPGSTELVDLFVRQAQSGVWLANDSSCGAGYAPLSELERVVLGVADRLRELSASARTPEIGEDTKILGLRRADRIQLTVACAFVDRYVRSLRHYVDCVASLTDQLLTHARTLSTRSVQISANAADDVVASNVYLTVTGTSAEAGDDGQVGRGNRVNGLIAPYRPMSLEAAAGKNPVAHSGKLYNVAAHRIAAAVVQAIGPVTRCHCRLASRIGRPVTEPEIVDVHVGLERNTQLNDVAPHIQDVVRAGIAEIGTLWQSLVSGEIRLF